jgi:hypothetical protein
MKKIYALLITITISSLSFGQNLVANGDFETWTTSTAPGSWTTSENITQESTTFHSGSYCAKQVGGTKKLSQVITGIVAGKTYTISYWYKIDAVTTGNGARIWCTFKDATNTSIVDATSAAITQNTTYLPQNGNVWTNVVLNVVAPVNSASILFEFRTYANSTLYWDDMSMVCSDCGSAPALIITSPVNATVFNPNTSSVSVNVSVGNFTVASGAGHIHYSVDNGATVMKYDTTPIVLNGLSVGDHTVSLSLVDNNHAQLNPAVTATVTFTIAGFSDVATIAELRAGTLNAYYQLTGAAVVSHVRIPTTTVLVATTRNQKFIQDQTGGILIDDSAAKITTTFVEGNAMSNILGQLVPYNGILEFVPLQDQPVVSQNNSIVPETVSLTDFNANVNNYECELLQFNNITIEGTVTSAGVFTPLVAGDVFTTATSYRVTDGTTTSILRTGFNEADYIGGTVPTTAFSAIALGYENVNSTSVSTPQFIVRKLADFLNPMSTQSNEIAGLKVYPNPVSNGVLHIESNANTLKSIALFDVLGKQVLTTSTENSTINVSNLKGGIYILKITEAGKTAVSKLVIK